MLESSLVSTSALPTPLPVDGRDDLKKEKNSFETSVTEYQTRGVERGLTGWDDKKAQGTAPFLLDDLARGERLGVLQIWGINIW